MKVPQAVAIMELRFLQGAAPKVVGDIPVDYQSKIFEAFVNFSYEGSYGRRQATQRQAPSPVVGHIRFQPVYFPSEPERVSVRPDDEGDTLEDGYASDASDFQKLSKDEQGVYLRAPDGQEECLQRWSIRVFLADVCPAVQESVMALLVASGVGCLCRRPRLVCVLTCSGSGHDVPTSCGATLRASVALILPIWRT